MREFLAILRKAIPLGAVSLCFGVAAPHVAFAAAAPRSAQTVAPQSKRARGKPAAKRKSVATKAKPAAPVAGAKSTVAASARTRVLQSVAEQMRDPNARIAARAYLRLAALQRQWPLADRRRAALALGHYQYAKGHYAEARRWFHQARLDPILGGYALYWEGLAAGAAGQDADAVAMLGDFLKQYPDSVMAEPALAAFADAATGAGQPDRAITALQANPDLQNRPELLLRLALAEQKKGNAPAAARDLQRVYDEFPLSASADDAKKGIERLRASLGEQFPEPPVADRLARAETLYKKGQWREAHQAYEGLIDQLSGVDRQRAALRLAECDEREHRSADALETLALSDPALDAERWVAVSQAYRAKDQDDQMVAAVEKAVAIDPAGDPEHWADAALFLAGNYYWANLKRDRAVDFYRRLVARAGATPDAISADWRIAWTAYLEHKDGVAELFRSHVQRFPSSPYVPDALYWLGRLAEAAGNANEARAYYAKDSSRFVDMYFGQQARVRLAKLGGDVDPPTIPLLDLIPARGAASPLDPAIPAAARPAYERAQALRTIGFDESAMLELRAAYRSTQAPGLLIDAARAAQAAEHYLTGAALIRQLIPNLETRPMDSVPESIWKIVYPFPYSELIRADATRYHLDPMLLAALIRQESGFEPDAVSSAGAIGLAQVRPVTGSKWSRKAHLWYSRRRLTNPSYNLRVGGAYFQALVAAFGSPEAALAAYNAGENRVTAWQANYSFTDTAEFVESIPFSQTRNYVQVIMSGASIYRRLYEEKP